MRRASNRVSKGSNGTRWKTHALGLTLPWRTVASCFTNSILWSTAAVHIPASTVGHCQLHSDGWLLTSKYPTEDLVRLSKPKTKLIHGHELFIRLCTLLPHIRPISRKSWQGSKAKSGVAISANVSANVERYLLLLRENPPPCLADSSSEVRNGSTCRIHILGADQTRAGNLKMNGSLESLKKIVTNLNDAQLNPNTGASTYLSTHMYVRVRSTEPALHRGHNRTPGPLHPPVARARKEWRQSCSTERLF